MSEKTSYDGPTIVSLRRQLETARAERDAMLDAQQLTDERLERAERQLDEARAEVERLRAALRHFAEFREFDVFETEDVEIVAAALTEVGNHEDR